MILFGYITFPGISIQDPRKTILKMKLDEEIKKSVKQKDKD